MYSKYFIWSPDRGETVDDAHEVTGYTPEDASERWASANFSRWDFPMEFEFMVTASLDDPPTKVSVGVETVPHFYACIVKEKA